MGFGGGGSDSVSESPTKSSAEVQEAARVERLQRANVTGRASTIVTGGQGLATEEEPIKKKEVLS